MYPLVVLTEILVPFVDKSRFTISTVSVEVKVSVSFSVLESAPLKFVNLVPSTVTFTFLSPTFLFSVVALIIVDERSAPLSFLSAPLLVDSDSFTVTLSFAI